MNKQKKLSPVLESIQNDIAIAGEMMRQFSMHVIDQEISNFPVYIAYQDEVNMGKTFLETEKSGLNWNYNASIIEEFVKRGAVAQDKIEDFMETYGDPEERACMFLVLPNEGGFIFMPYGEAPGI
ncbi:MAG: hypothetical protein AAF570_02255 [Bacteroidota bacterium]